MLNYLRISVKSLVLSLLLLGSWQYANADTLEGVWSHNNQKTTIRPGSSNHIFIFCNEIGDCAEGAFHRNVIFVPKWEVKGIVNENRNSISWTNGTQWSRGNFGNGGYSNAQPFSGIWYHDGKMTTIQFRRDGFRFILKNEFGQYLQGYLKGDTLFIPRVNLTGTLSKHGKKIRWSNGTVWYRNR